MNEAADPGPPEDNPLVPSRDDLRDQYRALGEDLRHSGGRVDAARSFGVITIGAVLSLAIQQHLAVLALAAELLAYCFALVDLVNSHTYATFAQRARRIELALDAYEEAERYPDDLVLSEDLAQRLDGLGRRPYRAILNEPGRNALAFTPPKPVFHYLYPLLLIGSAVLAVLIQWRSGSAAQVAEVIVVALVPLALFARGFLDPKWAPIEWWRESGAGPIRRATGPVLLLLCAVLLVIAALTAVPALSGVPRQSSGVLRVASVPSRALDARIAISPRCAGAPGVLRLSWPGSISTLQVALPGNFESRDGRHVLTFHPRGSAVALAVQADGSAVHAGRCTLALPTLVGRGGASLGETRLRLPRESDGFRLEGTASALVGTLGPCASGKGGVPIADCAGVLHLTEPGEADRRLIDLALSAAAVAIALVLVAAYLFVGLARRPRRGRAAAGAKA